MHRVHRKLVLQFLTVVLGYATLFFLCTGSLQSNGAVHLPQFTWERFFNCIYFSVVTVTTLGYGDLTPLGVGKVFAATETIVGVLFAGYSVSEISRVVQESRIQDRLIAKLVLKFQPVNRAMHTLDELCSIPPISADGISQREGASIAMKLESAAADYTNELQLFVQDDIHDVLLISPADKTLSRLAMLAVDIDGHVKPVCRMLRLFSGSNWALPDAAGKELFCPLPPEDAAGDVIMRAAVEGIASSFRLVRKSISDVRRVAAEEKFGSDVKT